MKKICGSLSVLALVFVLASCGSPAGSLAAPSAVTTSSSAPVAVAVGTITGSLGYPADFIPPTTAYAVNVADPRIFFSVDTPRYGGGPGSPPSATIVPGVRPSYTIADVALGTYYVFAYRNDNDPNYRGGPALHSQFVIKCIRPALAGTAVGAECNSDTADHSLVRVTVRAGETVSRIDIMDWTSSQQVQQGTLPPRP